MVEVAIAKKFDINDEKTLRKTKELMLLLDSRKPSQCSESCKVAVCLELACSLSGLTSSFSRENAIKYSGCKKSVYINQYNLISKLLKLDKIYTIRELCLTLGINEVQESASSLLEKYKKSQKLSEEELEHPMLSCAAVLAAARCNKVRVNVSKLVELSRIKKPELEALAGKLEKLSQTVKKSTKRSSDKLTYSSVQEGSEFQREKKPKVKTEEEEDAEYLEWKMRMLEE